MLSRVERTELTVREAAGVLRVRLQKNELDALAEIGTLNALGEGLHRREAMWQLEGVWRPKGPLFDAQDDSLPEP